MSKITSRMIQLFQSAVDCRRMEWAALDALDEEVGADLVPYNEESTSSTISECVYMTHNKNWRGNTPCSAEDVQDYLDSCRHVPRF